MAEITVTRLRLQLDPPRRRPAPFLSVRGTLRAREAVGVQVHDGDGHLGRGEAVPLPGYSRDDAGEVERVLAAIAAAAGGWTVNDTASTLREEARSATGTSRADWLDAALAPWDELLGGCAGARFALEAALVDLMSRRAGLPAAIWLAAGRALQPVPVSLLLPDDDAATVDAARAAVAGGFGVLKLKVARPDRSPADEMTLLAALRRTVDASGAGVRFRLDANGALDSAAAAARCAAWQAFGVELVEEPVAGAALPALPALPTLPLPWAADESLADAALAQALLALPLDRRPAAFVLKPAELGLARCLRLADAASARGLGLIVTHSLDGEIGLAAAGALAFALPAPPWPCGLAPHAGVQRPAAATPWLPTPAAPGLGVADDEGIGAGYAAGHAADPR